jgi:FkbM family methyltransferase
MKNFSIKILRNTLQKFPYSTEKIKRTIFRGDASHLYKCIKLLEKINDRRNNLIIDIGAFDGETCVFWAKHFPETKIIGFEPNPEMKNRYENNCSIYKNIKIYPCGLGRENRKMKLYITNNTASSSIIKPIEKDLLFQHTEEINVDIKKLDEIPEVQEIQKVLLMKIDTQGFEKEVLLGSEQTLQKTMIVLTEMNNHNIYQHPTYFEIDEVLRNNNFVLYDISPSLYGFDIQNHKEYNILKDQVIEMDAIYINKKYLHFFL